MKRDEVVTPAPMLERTVTAYVLTDDRDRKVLRLRPRRSRWNFRPMTVAAAALLVVALIGGLILGGRLLRDFQNSPSPAINQGELKRLEARPLVALPAMPADGICPIGPLGSNFMGGPAVGTGEVRLVLGESFTYESDWGTWVGTGFLVDPAAKGLFLVRARDLRTGATAYFAGNLSGATDAQIGRAVFAGGIAGQDQVNGQVATLHPELVLNASAPSDNAKSSKPPGWGAYVGYAKGTSGCIFFQVDHDHTTEGFVYGY